MDLCSRGFFKTEVPPSGQEDTWFHSSGCLWGSRQVLNDELTGRAQLLGKDPVGQATISFLTAARNRLLAVDLQEGACEASQRSAATHKLYPHAPSARFDPPDLCDIGRIGNEIKSVQQQLDSFKDTVQLLCAHELQATHPPLLPPVRRAPVRKKLAQAATADGAPRRPDAGPCTPPVVQQFRMVSKEIKHKISAVRSDPAKLAEFDEQCTLWAAEIRTRTAGHTDRQDACCNRRTRALTSLTKESIAEGQRARTAEAVNRMAYTRAAWRAHVLTTHACRSHDVKTKLGRLATISSLSVKRAIEATSARLWLPAVVHHQFFKQLDEVADHLQKINSWKEAQSKTQAVSRLESWWAAFRRRRDSARTRAKMAGKMTPWVDSARKNVRDKQAQMIGRFLKDFVQSRRVVDALTKLMKRTRRIQRWFRRHVMVRRARKALWSIQWEKVETALRRQHDLAAAKTIRRHKVGEHLAAVTPASTSPSSPSQPSANPRARLTSRRRPPPSKPPFPQPTILNQPRPNTSLLSAPPAPLSGVHKRNASDPPSISLHPSTSTAAKPPAAASSPPRYKNDIDVSMYKRIVGLPALSMEVRAQAIKEEMFVQNTRYFARLAAWEAEYKRYQRARQAAINKLRVLTGGEVDPGDPRIDGAPPPAKPCPTFVLSQSDLIRLIDTATQRVAAEIAKRVAKSLNRSPTDNLPCPLHRAKTTVRQAAINKLRVLYGDEVDPGDPRIDVAPPPAKPCPAFVLSQGDLIRLIDTATQRVAAEIAKRVAKSLNRSPTDNLPCPLHRAKTTVRRRNLAPPRGNRARSILNRNSPVEKEAAR
ncbi:hypothetical protein DIPPA_18764 [Diplonema papillatum]|nr:hypothetical protein DIPPA_18764 [Diplonema papillatum]